jgi:hypothetical protein
MNSEVKFDKTLKDRIQCNPALTILGAEVCLGQSTGFSLRTQFQSAYRFSRCASATASPTIGDVRALNKLVRTIKSEPVKSDVLALERPMQNPGHA